MKFLVDFLRDFEKFIKEFKVYNFLFLAGFTYTSLGVGILYYFWLIYELFKNPELTAEERRNRIFVYSVYFLLTILTLLLLYLLTTLTPLLFYDTKVHIQITIDNTTDQQIYIMNTLLCNLLNVIVDVIYTRAAGIGLILFGIIAYLKEMKEGKK
jgi:hypothetical protein